MCILSPAWRQISSTPWGNQSSLHFLFSQLFMAAWNKELKSCTSCFNLPLCKRTFFSQQLERYMLIWREMDVDPLYHHPSNQNGKLLETTTVALSLWHQHDSKSSWVRHGAQISLRFAMHLGPWPIPGVGPACVSVGRAGREKSVRKGEGVDSQSPICKALCQTERRSWEVLPQQSCWYYVVWDHNGCAEEIVMPKASLVIMTISYTVHSDALILLRKGQLHSHIF